MYLLFASLSFLGCIYVLIHILLLYHPWILVNHLLEDDPNPFSYETSMWIMIDLLEKEKEKGKKSERVRRQRFINLHTPFFTRLVILDN